MPTPVMTTAIVVPLTVSFSGTIPREWLSVRSRLCIAAVGDPRVTEYRNFEGVHQP